MVTEFAMWQRLFVGNPKCASKANNANKTIPLLPTMLTNRLLDVAQDGEKCCGSARGAL
jgi:hypothetical protein